MISSALGKRKQQGLIAFLHHSLAHIKDCFSSRNSFLARRKANHMADDLERRAARDLDIVD